MTNAINWLKLLAYVKNNYCHLVLTRTNAQIPRKAGTIKPNHDTHIGMISVPILTSQPL